MTWLLAVVLRPFGALLFFGAAAVIAFAIRPLIPPQWRGVLYDRTIRKQHPWPFFFAACIGVYGTIYLVGVAVGHW
jgi:hypothetical protein